MLLLVSPTKHAIRTLVFCVSPSLTVCKVTSSLTLSDIFTGLPFAAKNPADETYGSLETIL